MYSPYVCFVTVILKPNLSIYLGFGSKCLQHILEDPKRATLDLDQYLMFSRYIVNWEHKQWGRQDLESIPEGCRRK